ncbi:MAG: hypothetical protein AB7I25_02045 [Vicinamibacterales bacterium]
MSSSHTVSESATFTLAHARHMAAKVATDLKRMQRLYGAPTDSAIAKYEAEATAFIKSGYLGTVTYGFRRNGNWIEPTLCYTARDLASTSSNDDSPGRIRPGANIDSAKFYSYLTYSASWDRLSDAEREAFQEQLPVQRNGASAPGISGHLASDRTYSAGGRSLDRSSVRSL